MPCEENIKNRAIMPELLERRGHAGGGVREYKSSRCVPTADNMRFAVE